MNKMSEYWGYHLIIDCQGCKAEKITNREEIKKFIKTLVNKIDMKAYKDPIIEHFATHNPEAAGFSFVQLIETSAITGHLVDKNGDAYIDIFSCKKFDIDVARKFLESFFAPKKMKIFFLTRQA
jgi:S-adenosylmethionine/arginine decarboxylase-like enzyme